MGFFGGQIRIPRKKLHSPDQKSSLSELYGPISCQLSARRIGTRANRWGGEGGRMMVVQTGTRALTRSHRGWGGTWSREWFRTGRPPRKVVPHGGVIPTPSLPPQVSIGQKPRNTAPLRKGPKACWEKLFPGRNMGTKWVQIAPMSMSFGQDCSVFHKDSESGLKMGRSCERQAQK